MVVELPRVDDSYRLQLARIHRHNVLLLSTLTTTMSSCTPINPIAPHRQTRTCSCCTDLGLTLLQERQDENMAAKMQMEEKSSRRGR